MKNITKSLIFCSFVLNFCWASVNTKASAPDPKIPTENKNTTAVKSSTLNVKNEVKLPDIDFSKLLTEVSKKLGTPLPLLIIEGESLPKLLQKAIQIAEKVVPDSSSLLSFAITGFAGGLSCPGVDEKAACYAVMFLYEGTIEPVFLFKAQSGCMLTKSLSENKETKNTLKTIPSTQVSASVLKTENKNAADGASKVPNFCWQMYGSETFLKTLDKNLEQTFPFIYKEKNPEMCLKIGLDINIWNDIFQKIENKDVAFLKLLWDTFVVPDLKRVEIGFDILDKTLETKMFVYSQEYSSLASFAKSLEKKNKEIKFLNWSSRESLQELVFQNYLGLKNYVESIDSRIKYSQNVVDFWTQFKNVWTVIYPLAKDILDFCERNLTGNTQSYADLQSSADLISSKGFGFFEGKQLKRENLLKFADDFAGKIKTALKEYVDKKYFCWELCKDISLNVKRSVEKHHNCDIDQIFWKGNAKEGLCPIWFAVYKNYLLYADDIGNLKRLIERMEEMKTPSYLLLEGNCYSRMKLDFASIIHTLDVAEFKSIPELSAEITCSLNAGVFVNTVKIPGFWDAFSLKTILPSANENAKKESVNPPNRLMTVPTGK